ncbi:hypothetical protein E2C01_095559 [Portunus trituberculatus]|uniref:Uncharacterized protein n=1 Tax=Portunus trituberculatus TaxID=210409 RepID=A0A5B7K4I3_PORTR|nr:hypothetical protein [Portunus trituberculatus]
MTHEEKSTRGEERRRHDTRGEERRHDTRGEERRHDTREGRHDDTRGEKTTQEERGEKREKVHEEETVSTQIYKGTPTPRSHTLSPVQFCPFSFTGFNGSC